MPGMDYQNLDYTSAVLSAYNSLLTSHESIITIADQFSMEERYMRELISVSVDNDTRLLTITTYGEDADEASRIMDLMLKRMEAVRENIETTVGNHNTKQVSRSDSTTVLTWLRDSQQDTRDNMIGLQNNLTDLQNNHELLERASRLQIGTSPHRKSPRSPSRAAVPRSSFLPASCWASWL